MPPVKLSPGGDGMWRAAPGERGIAAAIRERL